MVVSKKNYVGTFRYKGRICTYACEAVCDVCNFVCDICNYVCDFLQAHAKPRWPRAQK